MAVLLSALVRPVVPILSSAYARTRCDTRLISALAEQEKLANLSFLDTDCFFFRWTIMTLAVAISASPQT